MSVTREHGSINNAVPFSASVPVAGQQFLVPWHAPPPWLAPAIEDGHVRGVIIVGTPLDVPIAPDETVVEFRAYRGLVNKVSRPVHCAVIVRTIALPAPQLDHDACEAIAQASCDSLLAEAP